MESEINQGLDRSGCVREYSLGNGNILILREFHSKSTKKIKKYANRGLFASFPTSHFYIGRSEIYYYTDKYVPN